MPFSTPRNKQKAGKSLLFSFCDKVTESNAKNRYNINVNKHKGGTNMSVLNINKSNFDSVSSSGKKMLLDFYAEWCGPCRMVAPILAEIADEREDIIVGKINVDEEPELANAFGVYSIPTLVVLEDKKILGQATGARPKAKILSLLGS
jgi:thioredoxin 1